MAHERAAGASVRILVVDPHSPGHHATYLRWIVEAIGECGWTAVVATTANALEHPLLRDLASRKGVEVRIIDAALPVAGSNGRLEIIRCELAYWRIMRRIVLAEQTRGSLTAVVLPYLDYCFFACGVLGPPCRTVPWHTISMRLSAVNGENASGVPWRWRLARRLLSAASLRTLFTINPSVRALPSTWLTSTMAAKLKYLPDPAEYRDGLQRTAARARLDLEPDRLAVLVFGSIDERKGLGRLAAALAADERLARSVLVVAGAQTPQIRAAMTAGPPAQLRSQRRLIVLDRTLDDAEQALVFAAADVVWLGYERHAFMSGVLVLAGRAALPVVATRFGEVGAFVEHSAMGLSINPGGSDEVCAALLMLMDEALRRDLGERAHAALAEHTPERFKQGLVEAIEASLPVSRANGVR
jgi:hypothetical protein